MNITYLRASSIEQNQDCEWKSFLIQICGFISASNKKAFLGTISHHVLELLAKARMVGYTKLYESFRTNPELLLDICWKHYKAEPNDFTLDDDVDYNFCLKQVYSVLNSKYNPLNLKPIKTEHQFQIEMNLPGFETLDGKNMELRGTIDLITEFSENCIEIVDYKTGERKDWGTGKLKEYEDFLETIQFKVYNLATSKLYSQYKYRLFTMIFTRDGGPFTVTFNIDEIDNTIDLLRRKFNEILSNQNPKRILRDRERVNESWKCNYVCQFGKVIHEFISDDGEVIEETFKYILPKYLYKGDYPIQITKDGKVYLRFTSSIRPKRICDRYYDIFREKGINKAQEILHQVALDESLKLKTSRRNDYSSNKIDKIKYVSP